ncbi:MAG TPA: type VI secretion system tube protein Hcp [Symbiobacteriaceae bacterium]|nr:type VI secretion system tube protein Hcp [Symbiobacteriaceae bacterium]
MRLMQKVAGALAALAICAGAVMIVSQPVNGAPEQKGGVARPGAQAATLTIDGQRQGRLPVIELTNYSHEIISPRDIASGLPTGQRQHKPFVIIKDVDKSTPQLMSSLTTNENLKTVVFTWPQGNTTYTVKLTNANIASIRQEAAPGSAPHETVAFTYQRIEWTYTAADGTQTTTLDDWDARN